MHERRERAPVSVRLLFSGICSSQMLMAEQTPYFCEKQETHETVLSDADQRKIAARSGGAGHCTASENLIRRQKQWQSKKRSG